MNKTMSERAKMIMAMEYIARQINNEDVFETWLMCGVADGDINYGDFDISNIDEYYLDDITFKNIMSTFLVCMDNAFKDGGLYCGNVVSKDRSDYKKKDAELESINS